MSPVPPVLPSRRARVAAALAVGLLAALWVWADARVGGAGDVDQVWQAVHVLARSGDPYALIGPGRAVENPFPFYYPLPTVLLFAPLAFLPLVAARAVFVGASAGLLAYGLARDGWWRLWALASGAFWLALLVKQWSPLLTASALLPGLAVAWAAKPTVGAAVAAGTTSRRSLVVGAIAGALLVAVSFALQPGWLGAWLANTRDARHVVAPVTLWRAGGPLVLLALLRWRRPEARLLVALACVPQTTLVYEALPLVLVARSRLELIAFALLSWGAWLASLPAYRAAAAAGLAPRAAWEAWEAAGGRWMVWLCYLPCVVLVLRRPNAGAVTTVPTAPAWLAWRRPAVRGGSSTAART